MEYGRLIKNCRMCESINLYQFLDLGFSPPSDAILSLKEINEPETHYPLRVAQCGDCGLTQLTYAVNPSLLYGYQYKYESSMTQTGRTHFFAMADSICQKFNLEKNSFVVDIGSNVGVLLEGFKKNGMNVLGIDPAPEIAKAASERGIETWQEFLNPNISYKIFSKKGKAKVVTATNVFAHIDDKKGLIESLDTILDDKGIFVIEAPYLVDLIDKLEYDTIYLEHLEYTSIKPLNKFFNKYNLEIFDVEKQDIHGSSVRIFVGRKDIKPISKNVEEFSSLENEKKIYTKTILDDFAEGVKKHKKDLMDILIDLKRDGKRIIGISAPAKGNTILNYCKIGTDIIDYLTEKSIIKRGHYTPGMHIPIVGEDEVSNKHADYGIIFAWNFADEIMRNNAKFKENGGKFIIPIPKPIII